MKTIEQLEKENVELRHQIEKYESVLCGTCRGAGTVLISIDDGTDCPECVEHDNNIKADAVEDAAKSLFSFGEDADHKNKLEEYANKLRGESE